MKKFEHYWAADPTQQREDMKEIVLNKNKRAFESAIDSAKSQKLDAQHNENLLLAEIGKGNTVDISSLLMQRQVIKNADATIAELEAMKAELFAE